MLEVALRHAYPGAGGFALEVEFAAPTPGVVALFGPSGGGKSSVLAAVAGLLRPREGRVALDGAVLSDTAAGVFVAPERRRCGVVFQDARLFPHLTVESNLRYGLRRAERRAGRWLAGRRAAGGFAGTSAGGRFALGEGRGAEAAGPGFEEVVALLGLGGLLRRRPAGLSGGERQRVALGRALLSRPRILLMDEPLASLDLARRGEVLPFLERLHEEARLPILYVTHALEEVDRLADTLVLIEGGRTVASGPVEALMARTDLPLLAGRRDAGVLLRCTVAAHDPARGLTQLAFPGGALLAPLRAEPVGATLRVRLRARDVAVAVEAPRGISVRNALAATVASIEPAGPHEAFLRVMVGPTALLARVTRDAVTELRLAPGAGVVALVKSITFDARGGG